MHTATTSTKNAIMQSVSQELCDKMGEALSAGENDVKDARASGLEESVMYCRTFPPQRVLELAKSVEKVVAHIARYSTHLMEAILIHDYRNSQLFVNTVNTAAVYVNVSTRFTDGGQFGFGCKIGLFTQKLQPEGQWATLRAPPSNTWCRAEAKSAKAQISPSPHPVGTPPCAVVRAG